jgi:hypothetical protein
MYDAADVNFFLNLEKKRIQGDDSELYAMTMRAFWNLLYQFGSHRR